MNKLLITVILLLFNTLSLASCPSLTLTNLPSSVNLNNNISPQVDFRVSRTNLTTECEFRVGIDRGSAPNYNRKLKYGVHSLDFALSKGNDMIATLKDVIDANNPSEYLKSKFKASSNPKKLYKDLKFFAEVTLNPNNPAGYYSEVYQVKLYQLQGASYVLHESKAITFFYGIPEQVSLSIVATNAPFDPLDTSENVNFGSLAQGQTKGFDVVIQSTSGYNLEISSANNGQLKHVQSNTNFIDYIFRSNGQVVSLLGSSTIPIVISTDIGSHPSDGFRVPLSFEISNVANKISGNYSDTLVLTVTSNL